MENLFILYDPNHMHFMLPHLYFILYSILMILVLENGRIIAQGIKFGFLGIILMLNLKLCPLYIPTFRQFKALETNALVGGFQGYLGQVQTITEILLDGTP